MISGASNVALNQQERNLIQSGCRLALEPTTHYFMRVINIESVESKVAANDGRQRQLWEGLSLRHRLMLLAAASILPFALFSVAAFVALLHQQKIQMEQTTLGMARLMAAAIDAQMQKTVAALEAFSLAQSLGEAERDRLPLIHDAARRMRASRPDWRGVLLSEPDGTVVFGSESALGSAMHQVLEPASVMEVASSRAPVVGPIVAGPKGNVGFTIRIPVMHLNQPKYVLTAIVSVDSISDIIQRQQVPMDWITSVFDSNLKRVARSQEHGRYFDSGPTPQLQKILEGLGSKQQAFGVVPTMEGDNAFTAISRIDSTGWMLTIGASMQIAQAALWRTASLYSAGIVLSLALGGIAFLRISRSITGRAQALCDGAIALGRGDPVPRPAKGLPDFDAVSTALWEAGQLVLKAQIERESLLRAETEARTLAEHTQGRLQVLLAATSSLPHSLDETCTLNAIALAIVPNIADLCCIDLHTEDGSLERTLTFHRDPTKVEAIEQVLHLGKTASSTLGSFPWTIASGREYVHHFDPAGNPTIEDPIFRRFVEVTGMTAVCVVPLHARGRAIGAMAAIQVESDRIFKADDVTLLRELGSRAALALDNVRLYSECSGALDKANAAGKTKDEFLAMLGHELRNPLAPILTALEIVKRRDSTVFVREREIIERQAKHLARLVDDLLDVSRIVSGKIQLHREPCDLHDVLKRAIEITQPLFEQRLPPLVRGADGPLFVYGDMLRLAQVVGNLLNNSAKFSESDQLVTVQLTKSAERAILTVEDRGVGIPDDLLPDVFERFVQSAQSLHRSKGGLGLGLSIARSIVELHGGSIKAQHGAHGRGTLMIISLPLLRFAEPSPVAPHSADYGARGLRILIVDDNVDAANMLADMLTLSGHHVGVAYDAEACLESFMNFGPDVCVLDIGLPRMDGYELAGHLRAGQEARSVYLIALTGYGQDADREKALRAGFDEHMTKPARPEILESILARARPGSQGSE